MTSKVTVIAAAFSTLLLFTACGGGDNKSETAISTTTVGQELSDLKVAYDDGALTEKEYERERKKILNR